jgi:hypothetical protein
VSLSAGIDLSPSCCLWLQGQLFGLMSALESIATAFTPWVANSIYYASPTSLPGLIWLVLAGSLLVATALLLYAWRETVVQPQGESVPPARTALLSPGGLEEGGRGGTVGISFAK